MINVPNKQKFEEWEMEDRLKTRELVIKEIKSIENIPSFNKLLEQLKLRKKYLSALNQHIKRLKKQENAK